MFTIQSFRLFGVVQYNDIEKEVHIRDIKHPDIVEYIAEKINDDKITFTINEKYIDRNSFKKLNLIDDVPFLLYTDTQLNFRTRAKNVDYFLAAHCSDLTTRVYHCEFIVPDTIDEKYFTPLFDVRPYTDPQVNLQIADHTMGYSGEVYRPLPPLSLLNNDPIKWLYSDINPKNNRYYYYLVLLKQRYNGLDEEIINNHLHSDTNISLFGEIANIKTLLVHLNGIETEEVKQLLLNYLDISDTTISKEDTEEDEITLKVISEDMSRNVCDELNLNVEYDTMWLKEDLDDKILDDEISIEDFVFKLTGEYIQHLNKHELPICQYGPILTNMFLFDREKNITPIVSLYAEYNKHRPKHAKSHFASTVLEHLNKHHRLNVAVYMKATDEVLFTCNIANNIPLWDLAMYYRPIFKIKDEALPTNEVNEYISLIGEDIKDTTTFTLFTEALSGLLAKSTKDEINQLMVRFTWCPVSVF